MTSIPNASPIQSVPRRYLISLPAAALLSAFTLVHVALAYHYPLAPDETYYWEWSRRLSWGYYDQGPMVAWWIRAGCAVFGNTVSGVRLPIVLASFLTMLAVYLLARDLMDERRARLALLFSGITPLSLVGGFIATYDPIQVLFWSWAIYFAARALFFGKNWAWIGLGLATGLGLLSKHTMVLIVPCLALFLLAATNQRRWLRRPEPYSALALALLVFTPNLWWQANHGWMTFRHLFLLAGKGRADSLMRRTGDFVGSQAGLIGPLLFIGFVIALIWAGKQRARNSAAWFLFCFSAPVLGFFLLLTLKSKVQANWAGSGWIAASILYALYVLATRDERSDGRIRLFAISGLAVSVLLCLVLAWPQALAASGIQIPKAWMTQVSKLYGGEELAAAVDRERNLMRDSGGRPVPVGAVTYDNASRLAFYLPGQPATWCPFLGTRLNSYVLWNDEARPPTGGNALLADDQAPNSPTRPRFEAIFERIAPVSEPVRIYRPGLYQEPVRTYYLYRCYGYRPNQPTETPTGG